MKTPRVAALVAAALLGLPAAAQDADIHAITQQQLQEERSNENFYQAYFPDLLTGRKAAITFHNQLMEARYGDGYLVLELSREELAELATFGFRFEPATEFL